jgi:hypothetical protein
MSIIKCDPQNSSSHIGIDKLLNDTLPTTLPEPPCPTRHDSPPPPSKGEGGVRVRGASDLLVKFSLQICK